MSVEEVVWGGPSRKIYKVTQSKIKKIILKEVQRETWIIKYDLNRNSYACYTTLKSVQSFRIFMFRSTQKIDLLL